MQNRFFIFVVFVFLSRTLYASEQNSFYEKGIWYLNKSEYTAAQYYLEFARADPSISNKTAKKIDEHLTQIRHLKKWDIEFGIGAIPDSNINYSPSNRHECINTSDGTFCTELPDPVSGIGLQINGATNLYTALYKNIGLRTTIGGAILNISNNIPTDYSTHFAVGPRYIFSHGDISIQPSFGIRMYNSTFYNLSYGVRLSSNLQIGKTFTDSGIDIQRNYYHNHNINEALRGFDWTFYIHPKYYINELSFISFTTAISHNHTELTALGSDTGRIAIGYFYSFPYGFKFYINAMYSFSSYNTPDEQINTSTPTASRRDNIYQFYTRIYNKNISLYNFIPALGYTYTIQDSNISRYDQTNRQIMIEIIRLF